MPCLLTLSASLHYLPRYTVTKFIREKIWKVPKMKFSLSLLPLIYAIPGMEKKRQINDRALLSFYLNLCNWCYEKNMHLYFKNRKWCKKSSQNQGIKNPQSILKFQINFKMDLKEWTFHPVEREVLSVKHQLSYKLSDVWNLYRLTNAILTQQVYFKFIFFLIVDFI